MSAPPEQDLSFRIVILKIVLRNIDLKSFINVPPVFTCQRTFIVLLVTHYKDLSSVFRGNDMWPHFLRISQDPQRRLHFEYLL